MADNLAAAAHEPPAPVEAFSPDGSSGARIMMADDEQIMMDLVQLFLEEAGYSEFIKVDQPDRVLEVVREERPDVLLLDLVMPGISGFDILEEMRRDERLKHLPVIVLTASAEAETKLQALELGATDFLSKPVDPSELKLRLRNTLEAKAYQDQLAYYDGITGLPNRRLFIEELDWAIKLARRHEHKLSVAQAGLLGFSNIDSTLGPEVGNQVLVAVAERIQSVIRNSDKLAGGEDWILETSLSYVSAGQFSIMLPGMHTEESASIVARRVAEVIAQPLHIEGEEVVLDSNIGIATYPGDAQNAEELLRCASGALQQAGRKGSGHYQFYSSELNERSRRRLSMENQLRHALERDELVLHYQPKVDVASDRIYGVEALLRWQNAELGMVSPDEFIPLAEESGLILPIGRWVIEEACRQSAAWREQGLKDLQMAVNVSALQMDDVMFFKELQRSLKNNALEPEFLTVELTESQIIDSVRENTRLLAKVRSFGCRISIDDFGTGYSSLSYLKQLPVDELKIDRSFTENVHADSQNAAIVTAVSSMASGLGLSVVCEGVEDEETLAFLKRTDCDLWQGYLCSRPVNGAQLYSNYLENEGRYLPD
ncbi:MAG: EAL domain-containing protein [Halioglobus sp.]|nr:EAL domain-containing protein [Halioglobus sp.]